MQPNSEGSPSFKSLFAAGLQRGAWAVTDQALFALSNFILNVVLARWLNPADYGAFSSAYAVFLLFGTLHGALLVEPMLVYGSGKYEPRRAAYLEVLLRGHWAFTAGAGACLIVAGGVGLLYFGPNALSHALVAVGICAPLILLQWLTRRVCYMSLEPRTAAIAGVLYMLVLLPGTFFLFRQQWLSAVSAIALIGVGSLVSSAYLIGRFRIRWRSTQAGPMSRQVAAEHWEYGRWSVGASALGWIPANIYYVLLPAVIGLSATGALKALTNLIMPVLHTYLALSILLIPLLVRVRETAAFAQTVRLGLVLFTSAALAYWLALGSFSRPLVHVVYKGQYDAYASVLWIIGLIPVAGAGVAVLGSVLRACERPQHVLVAYLSSAIVALSAGLALLFWGGVWGAALGMLLASLSTCIAMILLLWLKPQTTWQRLTARLGFHSRQQA